MIYITGDCHSEFNKFSTETFPEQKEMSRDDYVIISGDFGGIWDWQGENNHEKWWLDWLENKSYTTLFVDGNHENFERLYAYPEKEWHGGHVHEIRPHVLHLMRGYVFEIDGVSIFAFGGARSHDIQGGVFEPDDPNLKKKIRKANEEMLCFRINHRTWWAEEMPSGAEKSRGVINLKKHDNKVDFIVTHDLPASSLLLMSGNFYKPDELNKYLEMIRNEVSYRAWIGGHYHCDTLIRYEDRKQDICLYDQITRIH